MLLDLLHTHTQTHKLTFIIPRPSPWIDVVFVVICMRNPSIRKTTCVHYIRWLQRKWERGKPKRHQQQKVVAFMWPSSKRAFLFSHTQQKELKVLILWHEKRFIAHHIAPFKLSEDLMLNFLSLSHFLIHSLTIFKEERERDDAFC